MIISHAHRFIFVKPYKVAGTSVQFALAEHCAKDDLVTLSTNYDYGGLKPYSNVRMDGHMRWVNIRRMVGPKTWDEYLKVVCVRNPWDLMVSWFFNCMRALKKGSTPDGPNMPRTFLAHALWTVGGGRPLNMHLWMDGDKFWADSFIRFEHLDEDCRELFEGLGLEYKGLHHFRKREDQSHYSNFYTPPVRAAIGRAYKPVVDRFGYEFENQ